MGEGSHRSFTIQYAFCIQGTICRFCNPVDSLQLFELFFHFLAEDFLRSHDVNIAHQLSLSPIIEQLKTIGSSNLQIALPDPDYFSFLLSIGMGSPMDVALILPAFISNGDIIAEAI